MNSILDNGEKPAVLSAILKYKTTERSRDVIMESMDIVAGSAICRGSQNFVYPSYIANPVSITVEGSNTLTRSMIIFGQGINKSHPYISDILDSIDSKNKFNSLILKLINLNINNFIFGSSNNMEKWCKFFSLSSNASLLLGGKLKTMEYLSGRYADLVCNIYYGFALEWYCSQFNLPNELKDIALKDLNYNMHLIANDLINNHPHKNLHKFLKRRHLPKMAEGISDNDRNYLVNQVTTDSKLRKLWNEDIWYSGNSKLINDNFLNITDEIRNKIIQVDEF